MGFLSGILEIINEVKKGKVTDFLDKISNMSDDLYKSSQESEDLDDLKESVGNFAMNLKKEVEEVKKDLKKFEE